MIALALDRETLDGVCWRVFGRTAGLVEAVVALNPAAAELGPLLPAGTPVTLPDAVDPAPRVLATITLWD